MSGASRVQDERRSAAPPVGGQLEFGPQVHDSTAGYRRIAWLLITLVLVPSGLLIAVGILMFFVQGNRDWNLVLGILVLLFCGLLATGTTLVWFFLSREQSLSKLQTDFVSKVSHEL